MTLPYKKMHVYTRHFREIFKNSKINTTKIMKRFRDLHDIRYRYALLHKIKNVLTYYEYIFDFLKKSVYL